MLLFIQLGGCRSTRPSCIQIHLMLLFIQSNPFRRGRHTKFKYISCYCLSRPLLFPSLSQQDSNTSHVIVYRIPYRAKSFPVIIQIHLMLLFIGTAEHIDRETFQFKYISCYCLSSIAPWVSSMSANSNTSHVIVYPTLTRH